MALKVLMLRKKADEKRTALAELRKTKESFVVREAELEKSIDEAQTAEEQKTVEDAVETFEKEQGENETAISGLEKEIEDIEKEIAELERSAPKPSEPEDNSEERKEDKPMTRRTKFFGMTMQERSTFVAREDVKSFLVRVRELREQKRGVTGAELTIPEVMLDLLRDNINRYSKLINKVTPKPIKGKARQNIAGTVPEGVWTEMVAKLNELTLTFNQVEVDGYKVGGYIVIPNATLEDSDLNLAAEILDALGQSIGYALDKAILYGKGIKMPLGIVTRLAQTAKPSDYNSNAPEWKDLHASNITKVDGNTLSDAKFFSALVLAAANAKAKYSSGDKFWAMNETTYATIISKMITFNAAGTIVAQANNTLPVIGGEVVLLDFISDGDIIGGYGSLYLLAERAGTSLAQSDHVQFIEDNTVYKGVARYDGQPVIADGFVAINIKNAAVTTTVDFAADTANSPASGE